MTALSASRRTPLAALVGVLLLVQPLLGWVRPCASDPGGPCCCAPEPEPASSCCSEEPQGAPEPADSEPCPCRVSPTDAPAPLLAPTVDRTGDSQAAMAALDTWATEGGATEDGHANVTSLPLLADRSADPPGVPDGSARFAARLLSLRGARGWLAAYGVQRL